MKKNKFLPNNFEFLGRKIYVSQKNAKSSDENYGTSDNPYKTIKAAVKDLKPYDHIYIDEGVYREEIPLIAHGHVYYPNSHVHFHAFDGKEVYIKGSDVFFAKWKRLAENIYHADLPELLFQKGTYNPYELSIVTGAHHLVRPCDDSGLLPQTLGQIYVNEVPYKQLCSYNEVMQTADSFVVTADGKSIIVHFSSYTCPENLYIELTVRRRCINPLMLESPISGYEIMIQTHGLVIEHAAEPGPFCKCRPESLRINATTGVKVYKTFCVPGSTNEICSLMPSSPSYVDTNKNKIIASIVDDTQQRGYFGVETMDSVSVDGGKTWQMTENKVNQKNMFSYTLDEKTNTLLRHYIQYPYGQDFDGDLSSTTHNVVFDFSRDAGKTWSTPVIIDDSKMFCFSILPLDDGNFVWPYTLNTLPNGQGYYGKFGVFLGKFENDKMVWNKGGEITVTTHESSTGIEEPSVAQFPDGRLIAFFRQGAGIATQDSPGIPSVKLFSISEDGGHSWTYPEPLCYENGRYIYSPRAFHISFRSIKNNKVYIVMNISEGAVLNCDPRTHLYLAEIDPKTLTVHRNKISVIESKHSEHHSLVRFSNFQLIQERSSRNPVIFMKLDTSEFCPILQGYDVNMYRYEIFVPEN